MYPVSPWWEPAPAAGGTQRARLCLATAQLTAAPRSTVWTPHRLSPTLAIIHILLVGASSHHSFKEVIIQFCLFPLKLKLKIINEKGLLTRTVN